MPSITGANATTSTCDASRTSHTTAATQVPSLEFTVTSQAVDGQLSISPSVLEGAPTGRKQQHANHGAVGTILGIVCTDHVRETPGNTQQRPEAQKLHHQQ